MGNWRKITNKNSLKGWQPMPRSRWTVKKEKSLSEGEFIIWELLLTLAVWDCRKIDWLEVRESYDELSEMSGRSKPSISRDVNKLIAVGLVLRLDNGRLIPTDALDLFCHRASNKKLFMEAFRFIGETDYAQNDSFLYMDFVPAVSWVKQSVSWVKRIRAYIRGVSLGFSLKVNKVISNKSIYVNNVSNVDNVGEVEASDTDTPNSRLAGTGNKEWLKNIPDEELEHLAIVYQMEVNDVVTEGEKAYDYLEAEGKTVKNYQAYLNNWLRRGEQHDWLKERF